MSRHGTRCGIVFLLSHDLSQVHRKGDLGDEDDGKKGDTIMLLNGDDGRPKRGALCGSHKTVVPNCVNVWFYCVASFAVLFGASAVRVKTDALVISPLLVPCVCVVGFRRSSPQLMRRFLWPCDSTGGCAQTRGCGWLAKGQSCMFFF